MRPLTIFSWGYWGWGTQAKRFVRAVDAVEAARGFAPPVFVDTRIHRSVRATDFNGSTFAGIVGPSRYVWMKSLGNKSVAGHAGPAIQIAEPSSAAELLDLALEKAGEDRRIIFYCGCLYAKTDGRVNCHRTRITTLLLNAARRRGEDVEVVEWPGGEPATFDLTTDPKRFLSIQRQQTRNLPPGRQVPVDELAAAPLGSVVRLSCDGLGDIIGICDVARLQRGEWNLELLRWRPAADVKPDELERWVDLVRRSYGVEPRLSK